MPEATRRLYRRSAGVNFFEQGHTERYVNDGPDNQTEEGHMNFDVELDARKRTCFMRTLRTKKLLDEVGPGGY